MDPHEIKLPEPPPENPTARRLRTAFGYLIAIVCLAWVVRHVHPQDMAHGILQLKWPLVLAAIASDTLSYICQGLRWRLLLQPIAHVRLRRAVQGVYVGLFSNDVLPMRFGEVVRAHLLSRWYSKELSEIFPSIVVERMFEGVWLALGIGLITLFIPLPPYVKRGAQVFGALILLFVIGFLYVVFRKEHEIEAGEEEPEPELKKFPKVRYFISEVAIGLREIGLSSIFYMALATTLLTLALQATAVWLMIRAYGLPLSIWAGAVVYLIIRVGIILPTAPANIGTYQFFASFALQLFGVNRSVATEFSFVLYFVLTGVIWLLGFFALSRTGVGLFQLRREAGEDHF